MLMAGLPDAKEAKGGGKPRSKPRQQQAKPRKAAAAAAEEDDEMAEAEGGQPAGLAAVQTHTHLPAVCGRHVCSWTVQH